MTTESKSGYMFDGIEFSSLKAFCDTHDILPNILYNWSHRNGGVDRETGLTEFMEYYRSHGYTDHNNMTYKKLKDMAKAWNVPYTVLKERLSLGWHPEKALTTPYASSKKRIEYNGKQYATIRAMCFDLGIQLVDVYGYKAYHKCELIQAVDHYVKKRDERLKAIERIDDSVLKQPTSK